MNRIDYYERHLASSEYAESRSGKARRIVRLFGERMRQAELVVDLGAGTGAIRNELASLLPGRVVGIELDRRRIHHGAAMVQGDVCRLPFANASVDFAILNHLYEHVDHQNRLFKELFRVLKPGGEAFMSAGNRLAVIEPHYRLPFLSWLPRPLASLYLRVTGRGTRYEGIHFRTYKSLAGMITSAGLVLVDETEFVFNMALEEVHGPGLTLLWRATQKLPKAVRRPLVTRLIPQWFFILRRPQSG